MKGTKVAYVRSGGIDSSLSWKYVLRCSLTNNPWKGMICVMERPKFVMHIIIIIIVSIGTISCNRITFPFTPKPAIQPGNYQRWLTVKGQSRSYHLHVPANLDSLKSVPLVFAFHGYGGNALSFQNASGFNEIADENSFLVVYPEGEGGNHSWNAEGCCGGAMLTNLDDVAFIRKVYSDMRTIANIDPKRIYATGFSNGGMFVYRLACEMSDVFAAIAPVAGPHFYDECEPSQSVSIIHVHGLADSTVPYAGGLFVDVQSLVFPPVEQGITTWTELDGCSASVEVEKQGLAMHTVYASCQGGTAVELYAIEGLDHSWAQPDVWPASQTIWEFFAEHPKP